jgi:hypothetical protein
VIVSVLRVKTKLLARQTLRALVGRGLLFDPFVFTMHQWQCVGQYSTFGYSQ